MTITDLVLISARPEDREFAEQVAQTAKLSFHQVSTAKQGAELIQENESPMIILVDTSTQAQYEEFESALQESVGLFSEKIEPNRIHYLSNEDLHSANHLTQSPIFGNFILRNYGTPKEAGEHYGRLIGATLYERAFGLDKLLKPGAKIQTVKLVSSIQKQSASDAVKNYLIAAKFQSRIADLIANAVDEIIMNSIFDAPVDQAGRPLYSSTSRNTVIKLEGKSSVEVQIGFDGKYVGVTSVDLWGSLDKTKLLNHMTTVYNQEGYKVKAAVAGAGIGLARVFQSGGVSFFFASENSARTEVTILCKYSPSYREFRNQFRYLSTQVYF